MGSPQVFKWDQCSIYKSPSYQKDTKKLNKRFRNAEDSLCEFEKFLQRGILSDLRYEFNTLNNIPVFVYYSRWALNPNKGKSENTRIWYCHIKNKNIIILLTIYLHCDGIVDIERHQAESLVKDALRGLE